MNFRLIFWLFVWEKINLDEWIGEASGPVSGRQVATLNNLTKIFFN